VRDGPAARVRRTQPTSLTLRSFASERRVLDRPLDGYEIPRRSASRDRDRNRSAAVARGPGTVASDVGRPFGSAGLLRAQMVRSQARLAHRARLSHHLLVVEMSGSEVASKANEITAASRE